MLITTDADTVFSGSVLPLGKMEINPVAGLVSLSKTTTVSDDKPSLADIDSDADEEDDKGRVALEIKIHVLYIPNCTAMQLSGGR